MESADPFWLAVGAAAAAFVVPLLVGLPLLKVLPENEDPFAIGLEAHILRVLAIGIVWMMTSWGLHAIWQHWLGDGLGSRYTHKAIGGGAVAALFVLLHVSWKDS